MSGAETEPVREPDSWVCPPEIAPYGLDVLYLAVACWALLQERAVSVTDVSRHFQVSERRACDILHYITHEAQESVVSTREWFRTAQGRRKAVRVLSVQTRLFYRQKKPDAPHRAVTRQRQRRLCGEETQSLRTWFVSRRPGEPVPETERDLPRDGEQPERTRVPARE